MNEVCLTYQQSSVTVDVKPMRDGAWDRFKVKGRAVYCGVPYSVFKYVTL